MRGSGERPADGEGASPGNSDPWLTVVTPSYEQAEFLGDNLRSVPSDREAGVEHVVVDGGSEDGTVELLERASEGRLLRWVSEPDEGHADAVNKGIEMARGEWIGIQNSDDYYLEGAFAGLRRALERRPGRDAYYANVVRVDARGRPVRRVYCSRPSRFVHRFRGLTVRHQSLFVRRDALLEEVGGWDGQYRLAVDYEWIGRLIRAGLSLEHVSEFWAAFREQPDAKTERASEREWREDLEAVVGGPRYPGGRWTRPLWRGAAALVQWTHIVVDNGPGALVGRLAGKWGTRSADFARIEPGGRAAGRSRPGGRACE